MSAWADFAIGSHAKSAPRALLRRTAPPATDRDRARGRATRNARWRPQSGVGRPCGGGARSRRGDQRRRGDAWGLAIPTALTVSDAKPGRSPLPRAAASLGEARQRCFRTAANPRPSDDDKLIEPVLSADSTIRRRCRCRDHRRSSRRSSAPLSAVPRIAPACGTCLVPAKERALPVMRRSNGLPRECGPRRASFTAFSFTFTSSPASSFALLIESVGAYAHVDTHRRAYLRSRNSVATKMPQIIARENTDDVAAQENTPKREKERSSPS